MKSRIFYTDLYKNIEIQVQNLFLSRTDFLSTNLLSSTRAAGDTIADIIGDSFGSIIGDWSIEYSANFARRAMADLAFKDMDGFYYVVDVKTHCTETRFNMPNLTSVERLTRFYQTDSDRQYQPHHHLSSLLAQKMDAGTMRGNARILSQRNNQDRRTDRSFRVCAPVLAGQVR